ncbi:MAG: NAD(P)-binding domain-containing protein, partial [Propionibacteriales bacterium]|nr:NAD(P)-binding domain-containing protein [Propionibacteriales bacterium]
MSGLERKGNEMFRLKVGVIGAGRVGAVLAAKLRAAGHEITAVSGRSDVTSLRIRTLIPGVTVANPAQVAAGCDILLIAVP